MTSGLESRFRRRVAALCVAPFVLAVGHVEAQLSFDSAGVWVTGDQVDPGRRIQLEFITRIGQVEGEGPGTFGRVGDIEVDPTAREVFVVDELAWSVKVFGVDGGFRRSWGREGKGPGEFDLNITGLAVARDTVIVSDFDRVHLFDMRGQHRTSHSVRPGRRVFAVVSVEDHRNGWILTTREATAEGDQIRGIYDLLPPEGTLASLIERPWSVDGSEVLRHRPAVTAHGSGLVEAPFSTYELRRLDATGRLVSIHRFESEPVEVTHELVEEFEEFARSNCAESRLPGRCLQVVEDRLERLEPSGHGVRPVVGHLIGSAEGLVLVERADLDQTPFEDDGNHVYDLVADDGQWLGRVEFPRRFTPRWLGRGMIWGVLLDDLDVPYVVGYRFR